MPPNLSIRRIELDLGKGLVILLVVFGHLVARVDPAGVTWYEPLRRAIYAFHMPFFLYLSGLVAAYSGLLLSPRSAWWRVLRARAKRLLIPFAAFGGLTLAGKLAAEHVMYVDHPPANWRAGLDGLLWHTAASPALSVWYLFVLFTVSLGAMAFLDGRASRIVPLLALALLLFAVKLPALCYADRLGTYAIFFALGGAAGLAGARWERIVDRHWGWLLALFAALLAGIAWRGAAWPPHSVLLVAGTLSMPALHGLLRYSPASWPRFVLWLGRYSFMIYLVNTWFIGLAKGLLLHVWGWDGANFLPFAMVLMATGLAGPVLLKRYALRHAPLLDRLTD